MTNNHMSEIGHGQINYDNIIALLEKITDPRLEPLAYQTIQLIKHAQRIWDSLRDTKDIPPVNFLIALSEKLAKAKLIWETGSTVCNHLYATDTNFKEHWPGWF